MNNALLAIGAVLIAALAALFAVPYVIDWNGYRGVFEEEASRMLGRDVRVGGKVDVRLLPVPYVSFGKLRIADAVNETGEPLFRADSFTLWLSVPPLLRGVLEARAVELKQPELHLVVDPEKGGNWASIGAAAGAGSLPFLPQAVALQSVKVTGGRIVVTRADNSPLAELTAIYGELEAEALEGPFRFKGNAHWNGSEREVRLSTARMDGDGTMRFKTIVRVADTANSYTLEGRVADLKQRPRLEGEISAKIGVPEVGVGLARTQAPSKSANPVNAASERPQVDLRSSVAADGTGFKLSDINLSIDNVGQPQLVSGSAEMAWVAARPAIKVRLGSRLLDLDRLSGGGEGRSGPALARALTAGVVDMLPADADVSAFVAIDQATLGGQDVSAVSLLMERVDGKLELKDLKAGVPGGGRLDAYGRFSGDQHRDFFGQVALRGSNLQRFLDWAIKGASAGRAAGPYLVQGKLALTERGVELSEASAEIGGAPIMGEVRYMLGERHRLSVMLDGRRVDAGQLWALAGSGLSEPLPALLPEGLLTGAASPSAVRNAATSEAAKLQPAGAPLDITLRVRTGELVIGETTLKDADADLALVADQLKLTALKGTTPDGLGLEIEGDLTNFTKSPRGRLGWVVSAPSEGAMAALQHLVGVDAAEGAASLAAALTPARLAGTTRLGGDAGRGVDVVFDGEAHSGRLAGRLRIDGERQAWRKVPVDLTVSLDNGNVADMLQRLLPGSLADAQVARRAGHIELKSVGTPESGLKTLLAVDADGLAATFDGQLTVAAAAPIAAAGSVRMTVADARLPAALMGLRLGAGAAGVPLKGSADIAITQQRSVLTAHGLVIGGAHVDGEIAVTQAAGQPRKLAADVAVDNTSAAALLAILSDQAPGVTAAVAARGTWSEAPLDLALLDNLDGSIKMRVGGLSVQPGMALRNAEIEMQLAPQKLNFQRIEGDAMLGRARASLTFERQTAGVAMQGDLRLSGLDLAALNGVEEARRVRGAAALHVAFEGRGLSPASLVAGLSGKGEAELADAEISGFAPEAVSAFAEAVLAGKVDREGDGFDRGLRDAFGQGALKLGNRKVAIEIVDGAARLAAVSIETPAGRTSLAATVDLTQLKVDGEWRVEPKVASLAAAPEASAGANAAPASRGPLPSVSMIYVGALAELSTIEPRLSSTAIGRELSVRRMEREVEDLERLRKADEERAKAEQERLRQQEAERLKALQQPAGPPGPGGGGVNAPDRALSPQPQTSVPAPAPAWSGTTAVTPDGAGKPAEAGASAAEGEAKVAAPAVPGAGADPGKDAAIRPQGEPRTAVPRPQPKPRPRQESGNNPFKWN